MQIFHRVFFAVDEEIVQFQGGIQDIGSSFGSLEDWEQLLPIYSQQSDEESLHLSRCWSL